MLKFQYFISLKIVFVNFIEVLLKLMNGVVKRLCIVCNFGFISIYYDSLIV